MSIYEKPVWMLMKDMVKEKELQQDEIITRDEVRSWFEENYPNIKKTTVDAHLLKMSTNAHSRIHYNVNPDGLDDLFFQIDSQRFRLYKPETDPQPIYSSEDENLTEEEVLDEPNEFAYERDLKNFLAKNIQILGSDIRLYEDEDIKGIEFPAGGRFIDILAVDGNNDYVVIELKVSRGYDRVIGQLMRYMAWIEENMAEPGQNVKGAIVARSISEDLLLASSLLSDVKLFEYELYVTVKEVQRKIMS
jgi:endonuclease